MQPADAYVLVFICAVFLVFVAMLAYATYLSTK